MTIMQKIVASLSRGFKECEHRVKTEGDIDISVMAEQLKLIKTSSNVSIAPYTKKEINALIKAMEKYHEAVKKASETFDAVIEVATNMMNKYPDQD